MTTQPNNTRNPFGSVKKKVFGSISIFLFFIVFQGCYVYEVETFETVETVPVEETEIVIVEPVPFVDTHVDLPLTVSRLLEPYVADYFTPTVDRYCTYLRRGRNSNYRDDQPAYVQADFNGDYVDDHAFLFSKEEVDCCDWYVTTRLMVVTSTYDGYEIVLDMELGTLTAPLDTPVEEFWSIGLMAAGVHRITSYYDDGEVSEILTLDEDGFYLLALDGEEFVYYSENDLIHEVSWNSGTLAKRQAALKKSAAKRVIHLNEVRRAKKSKK